MELLPAIDILEGKVVRLAKGDYNAVTVYNNDPVAQAQAFEEEGVRWIHVVDLDGARSGQAINLTLIEKILSKTLLKIELGGGIRNLETLQHLYECGVSRVVLGTSLITDPDFTQEALSRFPDMLCAGIDARNGEVSVDGWNKSSGVAALELVAQVSKLGFRHLVYTDISKDGMQTGIDTQAYQNIAQAFGHPVIASGGVANNNDIEKLAGIAGCIEGVIAGRAVYEKTLDIAAALRCCEQATLKVASAGLEGCRNGNCEECNAY